MSVGPHQGHALVYLLRLWRITNGEQVIWRAALQDVRTGERRGFASLDQAVAFLRQELEGPPEPRHPDRDPDPAAQ